MRAVSLFLGLILGAVAAAPLGAATISWSGAAGDNLWATPANWSGGAVPTSADDAVIGGSGGEVVFNTSASIRSLQCTRSLTMAGGSLSLSAGASVLQGAVNLKAGSITVRGSSASLTANGATTLDGTALYTADGGKLTLPNLLSATRTGNSDITVVAQDPGSLISFPNLATVTTPDYYRIELYAYDGATVSLPKLTQLQGRIDAYATGSGIVDISALQGEVRNAGPGSASIEVQDGGAIQMPLVTSLDGVNFTIGSGGQIATAQLKSFRAGILELDGVTNNFPGLTNLSSGSIYLENGARATLLGITEWSTTNHQDVLAVVSDQDSTLELPNLTTATIPDYYHLSLSAYAGGRISLPKLSKINGTIDFLAEGDGSVLELNAMTGSFINSTSTSAGIEGREGGKVLMPGITALDRVDVTLRENGEISTAQLLSITEGSITVDAQSGDFGSLTNINGTSLYVQQGGELELSRITQMARTRSGDITFRAADRDSVLSLPNLVQAGLNDYYQFDVYAYAGGQVLLPKLARFNGGTIDALAEGTNSVVNLPGFTGTFTNNSQTIAYMEARRGGTLSIPNVTALNRVNLTIRDNSPATISQLTAVTDATFTADASTLILPGITNIDGTDLRVLNGAKLTLSGVTQAAQTASGEVSYTATEAGSLISLPNMRVFSAKDYYQFNVTASSGARIAMPALTQLTVPFDAYAEGANSVIDLSGLSGVLLNTNHTSAYLEARTGGAILMPNVTGLDGYNLRIRNTGSIPTAQLVAIRNSNVVIDGANVPFPALADTTGTKFSYENGGTGQFTTPADLIVSDIRVPATVQAGTAVPIVWELTNSGTAVTNGTWIDDIFASSDAQAGSDELMNSLQSSGAFGAGAKRLFTNTVTFLPRQAGMRYIVIAANSSRTLFEGTNYWNNTNVSATPITVTAPDLVVQSPSVQPSTTQFGQKVTVNWTVRNSGTAAAAQTWTDRLYLVTGTNTLNNGTLLLARDSSSPVAAGSAYTRSESITIPVLSTLDDGAYYIAIVADYSGSIGESIETNNLAFVPLALTRPPLPDLAVADVTGPITALPGDTLSLSWVVTNRGTATATGAWTEEIALVTTNGLVTNQVLAAFDYTNTLAVNASLARTQQVTLPPDLRAGNAWFKATVDSRNAMAEKNETNNILAAARALAIQPALALQVAVTNISENGARASALLTRNGDTGSALTVQLASSDSNELTVPATVTFKAGEAAIAFEITAVHDGVPDADKQTTVTASAAGYASALAKLTVQNIDIPRLRLQFASNAIAEGGSVSATLSHDAVNLPVIVKLAASGDGQLGFPESIEFPAGRTSVVVQVTALENTRVEGDRGYTLSASAPNFTGASASLLVHDNDLQEFTLAFSGTTFSEGAGPNAASATISRGVIAPRSLEIEFENSNPNAVQLPERVTIPAGESTVSFPIAAVNNSIVDGNKTAVVKAFALATISGERVAQAGPVTLTVTDDDGPALALSISKDLAAEGVSPAATVTVSRNVPSGSALAVTLASSNPNEATVPASVTIPANAASATVALTTIDDHVDDGNKSVTLTASAAGFTSGSASVIVTDIRRPDLTVTGAGGPDSAETEAYVNVAYRVVNQGLAAAGTNWTTRIYLSDDPVIGNDTLLTDYAFNGTLPPGQFFGQSRQVRMPQQPGSYWVVVETDTRSQIDEILENNNIAISAQPIRVDTAYRATVAADLETGLAGTTVPLHGTAVKTSTGGPAPFALVNIHIHVRGTKRVISALADEAGNFRANFTPLPGEAGLYEIGAAHPGLAEAPIQDSFTLYGMKASAVQPVRLVESSSVMGQIAIQNLGDGPLTALSIAVSNKPANLDLTVSTPTNSTIAGLATANIGFAITARDASVPQATVVLHATTAEGATLDIPIAVTVDSLRPHLVARPAELLRGMKVGAQTFVEFDVVNEGGAPSGPVNISLPVLDWMHLVSPSPLPAIAPGATNRVTLQLTPAASMQLGNYEGTIAIVSSNANATVPFTFRALSEAKGDLLITAVDEYTYFADGAPKVSGAAVTILDAVTEQTVTNGVTDAQGQLFVPGLTEGYYELRIRADQHTAFRDTILVNAGQTNNVQSFLRREAVRYIWSVVPTEIEDRTRITITTEFEAFVPMPVVTMDPPLIDLADFTAEVTQIDLKVINHGLIAAKEAKLQYGEHPDWSFEPLITDLGDIPARGSITIPMIIRRKHPGAAPLHALRAAAINASAGGGGCSISGGCRFVIECGGNKLPGSADQAIINASASGNCGGGGGGMVFGGGGGPGESGGGGGGGGASSSASIGSCSPCLQAAFNCALNWALPPLGGCLNDASSCASDLNSSTTGAGQTAYDCAKVALSCAAAAGHELPGIGTALNAFDCITGMGPACLGGGGGGGGNGGGTGGGTGSGTGGGSGGGAGGMGGQSVLAESLNRQGFHAASLGAMAASGSSSVDPGVLSFLRQRVTTALKAVDPMRYYFGNDAWFYDPSTNATANWISAVVPRIDANSDAGRKISENEAAQLLALPLPKTVSTETARAFIDRWNRTMDYWNAGILNLIDVPAGESTDFIAIDVLSALGTEAVYAFRDTTAAGYADPFLAMNSARDELLQWMSEGDGNGVCAHVKLKIEQQAVMTRDAFDASLELINDSSSQLENVEVSLTVHRRNGEDATGLFAIRPPTLSGINAVDGTGVVAPSTSGKASWILVPTTDTALNGPEEFLVGGTLRYRQGMLNITVPLAPSLITVLPSPSLSVKYFHQRDVIADDPFTPQIEPSVPFSLAVMVQNKGRGAARNVRIDSAQPKIVENEKGLLADFKIIATEVAGQNLEPSLTVNFGQIDPGTNAIGRWLLTSTILGGFIDYSATFEHLDGLGNKKLSLIDGIEIHELIHIVHATGAFEDGRPDFLVNDIADLYSRPDTLHLSDGSVQPVSVVLEGSTDGAPNGSNLQVHLNAAMPSGWAYLRVPDPGNGHYRLTKVVRDDGFEVPFGDNVWTTDHTFLGNARRPVVENMIHIFDRDSSGKYTLFYAPIPEGDVTPPSSAVAALPAESTPRIPVSWSGADNNGGSGINYYDVYVSVDNGPFQVWLEETIDRSAIYQGTYGRTYAFYSVATDQAGNREEPHAAADARTTVTKTNHAPSLELITDRVVKEGQTLEIQPVASDPDGDELLFSISTNAPAGLVLNPYTGEITWVTTENSGPATYTLTLQVLDNGSPRIGVTRTFKVTVSDENTPPVISPIADRSIDEGETLSFNVVANDIDLPAQTVSVQLAPGAPAGASFDPVTRVFQWRPADFQGGTSYPVGFIATDNGTPSLSSTQYFSVTVRDTREDLFLTAGVTNVIAGGTVTVPLTLTSGPDLSDLVFEIKADDAHLDTIALEPLAPEVLSAALEPLADGTFRAHLQFDPNRATSGGRVVGQLRFTTVAGARSAAAVLGIAQLTATRQNGSTIAQYSVRPGRIFVIQEEPLVDSYVSGKTEVTLVFYAKPGSQCLLQSAGSISGGAWSDSSGLQMNSPWHVMTWPVTEGQATFFRVKRTN